jgi:Tol biopolymer transport system component
LTGETVLLVGGPTEDLAPWMAPDGKHFIFVRVDDDLLYIANADGTGVKPFAKAKDLNAWNWSPDSRRIAGIPDGGGDLSIIDVATGSTRIVTLERPVSVPWWLDDDRILLVDESDNPSATALWTINADGTGQSALDTPGICAPCGATTLPGSGLVAWTGGGRAHILDTATGMSAVVPASDALGTMNMTPHFSPDGKWLTVSQFGAGPGTQLTLIPTEGTDGILALGPRTARSDSPIGSTFSPDGTRLLVTFEDGSAWFFDLTTGTDRKTDWHGIAEATW